MSGADRRAARERTLAAQEAERRAVERRRRSIRTLAALAVLALVVVGGIAVQALRDAPGAAAAVPTAAPTGSYPVGGSSAPVDVVIYEDFQCPACRSFAAAAEPVLDQALADGTVRVTYRPVAILDRFSDDEYSTRSLNAFACAVDAGAEARALNALLYAEQPEEGGPGLSNDRLAELAQQAGADAEVAACIDERRFGDWTEQVTETASSDGLVGTPRVLVNGAAVPDPTPAALSAAIAVAAA